MDDLIECRDCTAPYCKGCNIKILADMLRMGKFDGLMTGNRRIDNRADIVSVVWCGEWISVDDRLPENEKPVLTFVGYEKPMIGFITVSSYFCFDRNPHWQWDGLLRDEQKTLFWMPLPKPPKGE